MARKSASTGKSAPKKQTYREAGVDIDLASNFKHGLREQLASTRRSGVLSEVGGFGGLFELSTKRFRRPVLVSSVDGVGTKLKVAFATDCHDTIGEDLVNHCVNDIAAMGAKPLFFLDYLATGKLQPHVFDAVIQGLARGCRANRCALLGGETAQMPGFYQEGEYDISGTIVGVVEKAHILDGKGVRKGDDVIGIASNGLHTNGYSLARRVLFDQLGLGARDSIREIGTTVGAELLRVHRNYGPLVQKLLRRYNRTRSRKERAIHAIAHITGGGFIDNIPRVLPSSTNAVIHRGTWPVPPIFDFLQEKGEITESEMYHVFNMGIGMVLLADRTKTSALLKSIEKEGYPAWQIGQITEGNGNVVLE